MTKKAHYTEGRELSVTKDPTVKRCRVAVNIMSVTKTLPVPIQ